MSHRWDKQAGEQLLLKIMNGEIEVPLRCEHCGSRSIVTDEQPRAVKYMDVPSVENGIRSTKNFACLACGRITPAARAQGLRRAAIKDLVVRGT